MKRGLRTKIFYVTVLCTSLMQGLANAQEAKKYPEVNILSPNVSSLGKYVDFPVNMHTGVPEISIPIYTVKEGPLELPISLSYHAAGLKVQETASWVGAGWSLNAGGVVSRTVKGLPDDEVGYDNYSFWRDYGYSNYFTTPVGAMPNNPVTDYAAFRAGNKDGEPDLFFFNFSGYSGKFYFRENRAPVMIPKSDIKIEPYFKSGGSSFSVRDYLQGFVITVPNGTKYFFGVTTDNNADIDPVEKSGFYKSTGILAPFGPSTICVTGGTWGTEKALSSWYLYKIESPDGKSKIELSYRQENYAYHVIEASPKLSSCENINLLKSRIYGVALERIKFSNGSVTFVPSAAPRQDLAFNNGSMAESANLEAKSLAEVRIESNVIGGFCTSFVLNQSYFSNGEPLPSKIAFFGSFSSDQKRLKLNSIQEFRCNSSVGKPPYVLRYYDDANVPRRLSFAQDHWGFNNGATGNDDLMPTVWNANTAYGLYNDNRESQWPQMRAGALRSIQYPTGGGTEFIFEPNTVTTSKCNFSTIPGSSPVFVFTAGMSSGAAGYGTAENRNLPNPEVYFYRIVGSGTGSGRFYIDNTQIAAVNSGETKEDYISLSAGSHTFRAYANNDTGSGSGVVVYIYPSNRTCANEERLVGGLRIKRIEQFGVKSSPRVVKSFRYGQANLYSVPVYIFKFKNELLKTGLVPSTSLDGGCKMDGSGTNSRAQLAASPVSVHPLQTSQGYHIGYCKVTEILPDGGYTVNEYKGLAPLPSGWQTLEDVCVRKIDGTVCNISDPVYPAQPLPYDFGRGNLKTQTIYDKFNNKLSESSYTEEYLEDETGVLGLTIGTLPETDLALPTHYEFKSATLLWQKQVSRVYNPSNVALFVETENTTEYNSVFHRQPTKVIRSTRDGLQSEQMTYAPDLTQSNYECPSCASSYNSRLETLWTNYQTNMQLCNLGLLTSSNFQVITVSPTDPVESFFQRPVQNGTCSQLKGYDRNPCQDQIFCRTGSWTNYQIELNELRKAYTACINRCKSENNRLSIGLSNPNTSISAIYKLESKNQIASPVESSLWRDDELIQSFYFDYQQISDPPLDINLKNVFKTELSTPGNAFAPVAILGGNIVKDSKYSSSPEVTYQYDQGRIVEKVNKDGVTTSYIWGYGNTVPIVKAVGVEYSLLRTAYNSNPTDIRSNSIMLKAQITTYQYQPVLGIVSITDPNGKNQFYDYDLLGRLLRIKDHDGKIVEQYEYQYQGN